MSSPLDITQVSDGLWIGTTPSVADYERLRGLGIGLVINMRIEKRLARDPHQPGLDILWLPTIDWPWFPIPMRLLWRGVRQARQAFRAGCGVLAHCAGGRHRSVAMAAAILIARGLSATEAMQLIASQRKTADPYAYYIKSRILRFSRQWQTHPITI